MKVSRTVHNAAGRPERISEILSIEVKPGWKKGTKITFPEKGDPAWCNQAHLRQTALHTVGMGKCKALW